MSVERSQKTTSGAIDDNVFMSFETGFLAGLDLTNKARLTEQ